jgi:hypothetical protein
MLDKLGMSILNSTDSVRLGKLIRASASLEADGMRDVGVIEPRPASRLSSNRFRSSAWGRRPGRLSRWSAARELFRAREHLDRVAGGPMIALREAVRTAAG